MGQILAAGEGPEPGPSGGNGRRHPAGGDSLGLNQLCGSGLRAVALGMQQIMPATPTSSSPAVRNHVDGAACAHLRAGQKMGDAKTSTR
jgi:acetyl-CoA C-acetyltransferase